MWQCPKCNRVFQQTDQDHICEEQPNLIDAYIEAQPESIQSVLFQVRAAIRGTLPEAEERIAWHMPTYWNKHNIIHFAAFQKHIGLYTGEKAIEVFADRLTDYKTSKGAIQFPYSKPIPFELIADVSRWCFETGNHH